MSEARARKFVVVGGGITGLAAAFRIVELGREHGLDASVSLLEGDVRLGGQIRTERHDGFLLDGGPDTLVAQKPAAANLARRLGLERDLIALDGKPGGTEIVQRGKLHRVPDGFLMMAPSQAGPMLRSRLFSVAGKARMLLEPLVRPRPAQVDDESLASFVTRRFGREVLDRVAEPMIASLYLTRAEDLSLRLTMPRFLDMERTSGSVTVALRAARKSRAPVGAASSAPFLTLKDGLGQFVDALRTRLPAGCVRTGSRVNDVAFDRAHGSWRVVCSDKTVLDADALVLASPAHASAAMLRRFDPALASRLNELEFASCATVTLAYQSGAVGAPLTSNGFFVPRAERLPILACSDLGNRFPDRVPVDRTVLRVFLGGATQPEILAGDDTDLTRAADSSLRALLRISEAPVSVRIHRFPGGMPQFHPGQAAWVADVRARAERHPGLCLAGSAAGVLGLPDCIASGEAAAERAVECAMLAALPAPLRQAI